jgi:hypothetical protein
MKLVINDSVQALRTYRTMHELAKIGKERRKAEQRKTDPVRPLDRAERMRHYANQSGWTTAFTPKQRRRLEKKARRNGPALPAFIIDEPHHAAPEKGNT